MPWSDSDTRVGKVGRFDQHVGSRIRSRRINLGMEIYDLSKTLGVSYRQVEKYEQGVSAVSAGRLQQIADALSVPVSFFFEGRDGPARGPDSKIDAMMQFLASDEGTAIARAFSTITDANLRRSVRVLVEDIVAASHGTIVGP